MWGSGVAAMYGDDYKLAASLYLIGIGIVAADFITLEEFSQYRGLRRVILFGATAIAGMGALGLSFAWIHLRRADASRPTPQSYLVFDGDTTFPRTNNNGRFFVGDDLAFNQNYKALGPNPVDVTETARWLYIKPKHDLATQKEVIEDFDRVLQVAHSKQPDEPSTMMPGDGRFLSAYAVIGTEHWKVTQRDLDRLRSGDEIAFVIVQITYKDNAVLHHLRRCTFLQPPAEPPGVWQFCVGFNQSD